MPIDRPSFVSRSALLAGAGLGTFTLAARPHLIAFAQEATPVATVAASTTRSMASGNGTDLRHNIDATPGTFYPTGTYLECDPFIGLRLGVWRASSAQDAEALMLY